MVVGVEGMLSRPCPLPLRRRVAVSHLRLEAARQSEEEEEAGGLGPGGSSSCASSPSRSSSPATSCCSLASDDATTCATHCRHSPKRRSLLEMSLEERMTPPALRQSGMGLPWRHAYGLCNVEIRACDFGADALDFCLLPSPELQRASGQDGREGLALPAPAGQGVALSTSSSSYLSASRCESGHSSPTLLQSRFERHVQSAAAGKERLQDHPRAKDSHTFVWPRLADRGPHEEGGGEDDACNSKVSTVLSAGIFGARVVRRPSTSSSAAAAQHHALRP
eukprot:TRINITY_DN65320_c0_g1_i1.p1 TRINITY_DN65320_c0_g1~~TRINITY_DN65320_c0_g1_i1.p1  ORF type:complete len:279 (-),score=42.40 TRINITY_DN65320_c0_g1_i1:68-904(-)